MSEELDLKNPEHPQWVRRRKKLRLMFGAGLFAFMIFTLGIAFNLITRGTVPDNSGFLLVAAGSVMATSAGIYVWEGLGRNK